jgi:tetratricopeptide (TPR) repeat protein
MTRAALILLLFGLLGDTGAEKGREGNTLFAEEQYAAAAAAYTEGLDALADTTGAVYTGLQNNRGLALHRQRRFVEARVAFESARRTATTDAERVRVLFNAANLAAEVDNLQKALRRYRQVLLLDPEHEAARFNYEFLKRQQGDRAAEDSPPVEPSPFARRLKKKAEALVARSQYTTASALMKDGLQRDSTVRAYRGFIKRIEEVAQIARTDP